MLTRQHFPNMNWSKKTSSNHCNNEQSFATTSRQHLLSFSEATSPRGAFSPPTNHSCRFCPPPFGQRTLLAPALARILRSWDHARAGIHKATGDLLSQAKKPPSSLPVVYSLVIHLWCKLVFFWLSGVVLQVLRLIGHWLWWFLGFFVPQHSQHRLVVSNVDYALRAFVKTHKNPRIPQTRQLSINTPVRQHIIFSFGRSASQRYPEKIEKPAKSWNKSLETNLTSQDIRKKMNKRFLVTKQNWRGQPTEASWLN